MNDAYRYLSRQDEIDRLESQNQALQEDLSKALLAVAFYEQDNEALQERAEKAEARLHDIAEALRGPSPMTDSLRLDLLDLAALSPTQETDRG